MHIGILQCGHTPDLVNANHGDFDALFRRMFNGEGFSFTTFNVVDDEWPEDHLTADGWLVTGSKHGAYEDHAFIPPLEDFIRAVDQSDRPMVGICFGHQIIAQALGGTVEKFAGGWAVGRHTYDFEGTALSFNAWHQDQVVKRPETAKVVATSSFCENAALRYGDRILTTQAHPEITNAVLQDYLAARGADPQYPTALIEQAQAHVETQNDEWVVARMLAHFLKDNAP